MLDFSISLQAVQSPCLVNKAVWTEGNTSSIVDEQHLCLLQAKPGPNRTRHVKMENITAPTECIYRIDLVTWKQLLHSMIADTFNGSCFAWSIPHNMTYGELDCDNSNWLSRFYDDNGITTSGIFERFEAFAERISNKIRMGFFGHPEHIFGQTLQVTVCVSIDYQWLTFPMVLAFITSELLTCTVFRNWRRRDCEVVWQTSILPFLFYGEWFTVQIGEDMSVESSRRETPKETLMDLNQMQAEAKQQVVRFHVFN